MPFDFTTAIPMTRALNSLISSDGDDVVQEALELHAVPRMRLILLSATRSDGTYVFYDALDDLAAGTAAGTAETLVDLVFDETIVSEGLRRCGAALAASWLINSKVGIIESQQKIAYMLEKQALADLDRIVKSPVLKSAVDSVKNKIGELGVPVAMTIMLGAEDSQGAIEAVLTDPNNKKKEIPAYTGAQLPYSGAPEAGRITANINGISVQVTIPEGDSPVMALRRVVAAYELLPSNLKPNANLGMTELPPQTGNTVLPYTNIDGNRVLEKFTFVTEGAKVILLPREYDKVVDVAVMTLYLDHRDPNNTTQFLPGIKGFIYGLSDASSRLTKNGPHTIAVDLRTGLATRVATDATDPDSKKIINTDTFLFKVDTIDQLTTTLGYLKYEVNNYGPQTIAIPIGSTAQTVCELMAQNMIANLDAQRVLAAVRPVTRLMEQGSPAITLFDTSGSTPVSTPCVEMIGVPIDLDTSKYVVTITEVPAEVLFGVSPINVISLPNFDNKTKSAIVSATMAQVRRNITSGATTSMVNPQGEIFLAQHVPTKGLQNILDGFKNQRGF